MGDNNVLDEDVPIPVVSDELIDEVMTRLTHNDATHRDELKRGLKRIARVWALNSWCHPYRIEPGEQRAAIRKVAKAANKILDALLDVTPEFQVALSPMLGEEFRSRDCVAEARESLNNLLKAAILFDQAYEPAKGAKGDFDLEEAVRDLFYLFEAVGLPAPKAISGRNGVEPKLTSPEAIAIGFLLQNFATLPTRKIANMIIKVRSNRKPTEPVEFAIFRTDPLAEIDACLLPMRHAN